MDKESSCRSSDVRDYDAADYIIFSQVMCMAWCSWLYYFLMKKPTTSIMQGSSSVIPGRASFRANEFEKPGCTSD